MFAHSVCVFKHVSSAQTILRSSFATSAFTDAFFVYYSRIVFGYFSKKVLLLRFPFPCTYPISFGLKTNEEPRTNQGTPKELPTTKKCFLLRLATSKKSLLRYASAIYLPCQMPLSISFTPLCKVSLHSRTSAKMSHR